MVDPCRGSGLITSALVSMHFPVNHPLRPMYRTLSFLAGAAVTAFGIVGLVETSGQELTAAGDATALGLKTNPLLSYLSIGAGVVVILATLLGRNVDRLVYLWVGAGYLIVGTAMMLLMG